MSFKLWPGSAKLCCESPRRVESFQITFECEAAEVSGLLRAFQVEIIAPHLQRSSSRLMVMHQGGVRFRNEGRQNARLVYQKLT